jgi:lipopolysaccharide export LptBFGC system permease protein LptF
MKKQNLLLSIFLGLIIFSCSSDDANTENPQLNFFNNAYLEIYSSDGTTCYADLFLTSGTATANSNNEIEINNDNSNVIVFNEIRMDNCEIDNPSTRTFDLQNGYDSELNTLFVPDVFYDITYNNGSLASANEYYAEFSNITFVELTFTSSNELNFEIRYENGTILTESYSGSIETYNVN